ncbi:peptide chain release factor N(5)-glutamine methyltransferase [Methylobacterium sp. J-088]|uniref:peptide chain release factor N(5)-glutamine methyltransferase n=1 Tax=Methylobacterium sp. J-088 TaxID=2836664 RepID=UPI001FBADFCB|nr:peptide chain release factor N(5)-glutamine methyltransferase [Methylobacterium sp. J-088]MCJ2064029.1 peptide chain release factor N(5)-glutamine methyltransferase [Methylobacterium sp. J-088]
MTSGSSHGLSRRAALRHSTAVLHAGGLGEAAGDARFLLMGLLGIEACDLLVAGDQCLDDHEAAALDAALTRRLSGEPVARILGAWEFWGLPIRLGPETLVPRPDTEILIEAALAALSDRSAALRCLDLGTGSGCILAALLSELPAAFGVGIDRSEPALRIARHNIVANGFGSRSAFAVSDWCDAIRGGFDLVVSNPPYIARDVIQTLHREVRTHDPLAALDGGADGLDAYRRILDGVRTRNLLAPGGALALEIGYDQAETVRDLAVATGFADRGLTRDLAGHDRVLCFGLPKDPGDPHVSSDCG